MKVAEGQQVPNVYLVVESATDAEFVRQLLAYADVPIEVMHASGEMAFNRLARDKVADHELVIVSLADQRPANDLVSTISAVADSSRPVLLLALDRDIAAGWPAALQNLPVVFTDGDAEAIGKRLRATIQILVSDYRKMLADRARRAAARAQRSAENRATVSPDLVSASRSREIVRKRSDALMAEAVEKLADADALVEEVLAQGSPSGALSQSAVDQHNRLVSQAREDLASFFEERFDAHLVRRLAGRALEAPGGASSIDISWSSQHWDVAIWVDALGSPSFNPVLVKFGRDRDLRSGLLESMSELDMLFGLYVSDDNEPEWELARGSIVVSIGARQLAGLSKRQFRKLMVETRDRLVHA